MSDNQLPRAYGHCTCSCHRVSGVIHMVACCSPSDEEREREWFERRVKLEDGLEIGVGGSLVDALPMTPTDNMEAGAGDLVERWTPTIWFPPGHNGEAAGDMKRSVSGEYVEYASYAALAAENARLREAHSWPEEAQFQYGDWVEKFTGEARWEGRVVSAYHTKRLALRYVVEVEPQGFQMIAVPAQLRAVLSQEAPK